MEPWQYSGPMGMAVPKPGCRTWHQHAKNMHFIAASLRGCAALAFRNLAPALCCQWRLPALAGDAILGDAWASLPQWASPWNPSYLDHSGACQGRRKFLREGGV